MLYFLNSEYVSMPLNVFILLINVFLKAVTINSFYEQKTKIEITHILAFFLNQLFCYFLRIKCI